MPIRSVLPPGYFFVRGNRIFDKTGHPVRIVSTDYNKPGVINDLKMIRAAGYNTLRYAFHNTTLPGQWSDMDHIVVLAGHSRLKVIFACHGPDDLVGRDPSGRWFDKGPGTDAIGIIDDARWIADWVTIAQRYIGNDTVIGFNLQTQPTTGPGTGINWGLGGPTDLVAAYTRCGAAIQAVNPHGLIMIEGAPDGDAATARVEMPIPDKLYLFGREPASVIPTPAEAASSAQAEIDAVQAEIEATTAELVARVARVQAALTKLRQELGKA